MQWLCVYQENRMRLKEEARRERLLNKRKEKIKNEIILKALAESTDLEALREEKRAIAMEEKRLKALIDLEKAKLKKKASHQVGLLPFPSFIDSESLLSLLRCSGRRSRREEAQGSEA